MSDTSATLQAEKAQIAAERAGERVRAVIAAAVREWKAAALDGGRMPAGGVSWLGGAAPPPVVPSASLRDEVPA